MSDDLEVFDVDYIKKLRAEGRNGLADSIIKSFRRKCEEQKLQDEKEMFRILRKRKKVFGICSVSNGCNNIALEGFSWCERCKNNILKYQKKNYLKKKKGE